MINTSNEYKEKILSSRKFLAKAEITLSDNTVLDVDDSIYSSGIKISDSTSTSGTFQIGSAIINSCTLILDNLNNQYSQYDFTGAVIRPSVGLVLSSTTEWINKGVFTVDTAVSVGNTIVLTALDNMDKLDTPFSGVTISFPATTRQLLQAVCTYCGVTLATSTFINDNLTVSRSISDTATTCREVVSYIAQLSGNFARCNTDGELELKWYDFGVFESSNNLSGGTYDDTLEQSYQSGDTADGGDFTFTETTDYDGGTFADMNRYHHIYAISSSTFATDDVVITGVQVKATGTDADYGETVLFGTEGYVISIENPLIQEGNANVIAASVGSKIVGMRFRPMTLSALSDPSIEAGDVAMVSDNKGNTYQTLITNISYTIGNYETITCDAETPSAKSSVRFSAATKAIIEARKVAKQEISTYDLAVQQLNNLMANSFGVFKSEETLEDGSTIYYMHDKSTRAESQTIWKQTANAFAVSTDGGTTYTAGFDSSGNAVLNVLSAIGVNADWIKVVDNFSVGSNFNVDSTGKMIASNAEIVGKITATDGVIAGMDITGNGLSKTSTVTHGSVTDTYTGVLGLSNAGFNLAFSNLLNTLGCGINVYYGDDNKPRLNLYARDGSGLNNDNILLNGSPVLNNIDSLATAFYKLQSWLITYLGYQP